jgi:hypothetical protein
MLSFYALLLTVIQFANSMLMYTICCISVIVISRFLHITESNLLSRVIKSELMGAAMHKCWHARQHLSNESEREREREREREMRRERERCRGCSIEECITRNCTVSLT